jgi:hypothetical protein
LEPGERGHNVYVDVPIENLSKSFEAYARTVTEVPARMIDILTAAILFRLNLKPGPQFEGIGRHLTAFPEDEVIRIYAQGGADEPIKDALSRLSDSVKRTDNTITKSFQIRQLAKFYGATEV